jgi:hypothetical protein
VIDAGVVDEKLRETNSTFECEASCWTLNLVPGRPIRCSEERWQASFFATTGAIVSKSKTEIEGNTSQFVPDLDLLRRPYYILRKVQLRFPYHEGGDA